MTSSFHDKNTLHPPSRPFIQFLSFRYSHSHRIGNKYRKWRHLHLTRYLLWYLIYIFASRQPECATFDVNSANTYSNDTYCSLLSAIRCSCAIISHLNSYCNEHSQYTALSTVSLDVLESFCDVHKLNGLSRQDNVFKSWFECSSISIQFKSFHSRFYRCRDVLWKTLFLGRLLFRN